MRIFLVAIVVSVGALFTCASALGASALSHTTNASVAQYGTAQPGGGSAPNSASGESVNPGAPQTDAPVAPANATAVQSARQLSSGSGPAALPFTGYLVVPLLLLGMALLLGGLVIRRVRPHTLQA